MTSYQGPHAAVTQEFQTTPGAVAIESLPPTIIATAFDVFKKQVLGATAYGIITEDKLWGADKVVYDENVIDKRSYDFYPPVPYARTGSKFGDVEISSPTLSADGVEINFDAAFEIPDAAKAVGVSSAFLPFYTLSVTDGVNLDPTTKKILTVTGADFVTARIQPGQQVFVNGTTLIGTVASVARGAKNKINLVTAYAAGLVDGDSVVIGAFDASNLTKPSFFYDETADFVNLGVRVGDLLEMTSNAFSGTTTASITSVEKKALRFNTVAATPNQIDYSFLGYKASAVAPGNASINIASYTIKRLLGFSENYGMKLLDTASGVVVDAATANTVTIPKTEGGDAVPQMKENDTIMFTLANVGATDERDESPIMLYKIQTIIDNGSSWTISVDGTLYLNDGITAVTAGHFIHGWTPKIETQIIADFRAIRIEEDGVVKRITTIQDIFDAWVNPAEESIDPRNELAFMMQAAYLASGGKVCYGINVDASADPLVTAYGVALDKLKLINCYCHAFGTTDPGVNALMAAYCLAESAPYMGHEKTGILSVDQDDVFLMDQGTGDVSAVGAITALVNVDLLTSGVVQNDKVRIFDSTGVYVGEYTLTETPTAVDECQTDYTGDVEAGSTCVFYSGRENDQAIRIGAAGDGIGERRVSMIWPGWFNGFSGDDELTFPPYYIAATITGADSGVIASQSFTNRPFSIPGISNISLLTNTVYGKLDLDEMGGGGVNVMIQSVSPSSAIKSRHDLTTNMDSVQFRERSITKQADVAAKTIRTAIAPYIGQHNITDDLITFLKGVCSIVSTKIVDSGVLASLSVTSIERDENIDDKLNIYMEATAFIAGNYYDVTLLVKTR